MPKKAQDGRRVVIPLTEDVWADIVGSLGDEIITYSEGRYRGGPDELVLKYDCPKRTVDVLFTHPETGETALNGTRKREWFDITMWTHVRLAKAGLEAYPVRMGGTDERMMLQFVWPWWEDWWTKDRTLDDFLALSPVVLRCAGSPVDMPPDFKVAMRAELQRFGKDPRALTKQLDLFHRHQAGEWTMSAEVGLVLDTVPEDRALHALQQFYAETNYQGDGPGRMSAIEVRRTPNLEHRRLVFPMSRFLDRYGVSKYRTARGKLEYSGKERAQALKGLKDLVDKKFRLVWERVHWDKKGEERVDLIVDEAPLIQMVTGYENLTRKQANRVKACDDNGINADQVGFELWLNPVLIDGIDNFFALRDPLLHERIRAVVGGRYPVFVSRFIYWLCTKNTREVKIRIRKLARLMRMDKMILAQQWGRIRERLEQCYGVAYKLGYIDSWDRTKAASGEDMDVFRLTDQAVRRIVALPPGRLAV